jgi:hypothetical protein
VRSQAVIEERIGEREERENGRGEERDEDPEARGGRSGVSAEDGGSPPNLGDATRAGVVGREDEEDGGAPQHSLACGGALDLRGKGVPGNLFCRESEGAEEHAGINRCLGRRGECLLLYSCSGVRGDAGAGGASGMRGVVASACAGIPGVAAYGGEWIETGVGGCC